MNSKNSPSLVEPDLPPPGSNGHTSGSMFRPFLIVIGVGILIATLFTAWTEPGLLPNALSARLSSAMQTPTLPAGFPTPTTRANPRIGIVAGHSGNDSGAVCPDALGGIREVDINLSIATLVRKNLLDLGYDVDLLAEFDSRLNGYQATALVSIHADSCDYIEGATGFKVAAAASTLYPEQASRLTNCLQTRYVQITNLELHPGSVTLDMTDYHAFSEIDSFTPAAIIEVGFMNLDRQILTQQPELLAQGVTSGILCYIRNEDVNTLPTQIP
jgi:N-acetylmuramoyl-L-alanine amidase